MPNVSIRVDAANPLAAALGHPGGVFSCRRATTRAALADAIAATAAGLGLPLADLAADLLARTRPPAEPEPDGFAANQARFEAARRAGYATIREWEQAGSPLAADDAQPLTPAWKLAGFESELAWKRAGQPVSRNRPLPPGIDVTMGRPVDRD